MAAPSSVRRKGRSVFRGGSMGHTSKDLSKHTDLVQLDDVWLCAHLAQQRLGRFAVWAVRLGEDCDGIAVDDLLRLRLGCHDGVGAG